MHDIFFSLGYFAVRGLPSMKAFTIIICVGKKNYFTAGQELSKLKFHVRFNTQLRNLEPEGMCADSLLFGFSWCRVCGKQQCKRLISLA